MIEDRVSKFELRGTVNLHLHGTVPEGPGVERCSKQSGKERCDLKTELLTADISL